MPWEKSYNLDIVLDRAARAFWTRGYEATSMAELVRFTGVNRASLYTAFTDKRTLFLRALEHYDQCYSTGIRSEIAAANPAKDAILAVFEVATTQDPEQPKGCLLINTAVEMSPRDYEIAEFVDARLRGIENFFHDNLASAVKKRTPNKVGDARATAQTLLGLFIGVNVLMRATPGNPAIGSILLQVRALLR